jgi:two-component system, chemotaxis family, protein-glutamate methylesterase/glutaminase
VTGDVSYELVVIGASWGGLAALEAVLGALPRDFPVPIAVAQHRSPSGRSDGLARLLGAYTQLRVVDVEDKQSPEPGHVHVAPPDYHLYVEAEGFALSVDDVVAYSRPSIDVLFESAADQYRDRLIGVVLTGANEDGAEGLATIGRLGGYTIVQNPVEAERPEMPRAALRAARPDRVLALAAIAPALIELCGAAQEARR